MTDKTTTKENQRLHAELKNKEKELKFLKDITGILTSTLDLNKSLKAIMKKTITMIGAKAWFFLYVDEEKKIQDTQIIELKNNYSKVDKLNNDNVSRLLLYQEEKCEM
ncbi:MAG: hypothetical protein AAB228_00590, partial [Nitrospirota bacterium]